MRVLRVLVQACTIGEASQLFWQSVICSSIFLAVVVVVVVVVALVFVVGMTNCDKFYSSVV